MGSARAHLYRARAGDDRAPGDARYAHALQRGLAGDRAGARAEFLRLARTSGSSSTAAWALYQAGLAARAGGDTAGSERLFAQLRHEFPDHPLALRSAPGPPGP